MKKKYIFNTANIHLKADKSLQNIRDNISHLELINDKIRQQLPHLAEVSHCGAIDYIANTIVIFVKNNASMYQVNNSISSIEDILKSNGFFFDKFLVKVNPNATTIIKPQNKQRLLTTKQIDSLTKIATAIGKPELISQVEENNQANNLDDEDLEIKL
ncbi:MAG: hypothetical protein PHC75_05095 [Burkholderiales bacterium]|nr:hypothetical protein [Burkholderiales bacterium]